MRACGQQPLLLLIAANQRHSHRALHRCAPGVPLLVVLQAGDERSWRFRCRACRSAVLAFSCLNVCMLTVTVTVQGTLTTASSWTCCAHCWSRSPHSPTSDRCSQLASACPHGSSRGAFRSLTAVCDTGALEVPAASGELQGGMSYAYRTQSVPNTRITCRT